MGKDKSEFSESYKLQLYDKIKEEEKHPREKKILEVGDFILIVPTVAGKDICEQMILSKIIDMFVDENGEPTFRVMTEEGECYEIHHNEFKTIYF